MIDLAQSLDKLRALDVLNNDSKSIDLELEILDPFLVKLKILLSKFNLVSEGTLSTDMENLVEQTELVREWQGLLDVYDTDVVFVVNYLTNLKSTLSNEIEDIRLETQFLDSPETQGFSMTDKKRYALYKTRELSRSSISVSKQLLLWDSLRAQFKKKSTDLKNTVLTIKTLIHSHEIRPEIFMDRRMREARTSKQISENIKLVESKYLPLEGVEVFTENLKKDFDQGALNLLDDLIK